MVLLYNVAPHSYVLGRLLAIWKEGTTIHPSKRNCQKKTQETCISVAFSSKVEDELLLQEHSVFSFPSVMTPSASSVGSEYTDKMHSNTMNIIAFIKIKTTIFLSLCQDLIHIITINKLYIFDF